MESNQEFLERIKKNIQALRNTPPLQSVPVTMLTFSRLLALARKGMAAEWLVGGIQKAMNNSGNRWSEWGERAEGVADVLDEALAAYQEAIKEEK